MRLRTPKIDLLQVHNLDGVEALLPLMQQWKQAGALLLAYSSDSEVLHGAFSAAMGRIKG